MDSTVKTTVLEAGGLHWATSAAVVQNVLARRPDVLGVQANAVAQTATVRYDSARTSVAETILLFRRRWLRRHSEEHSPCVFCSRVAGDLLRLRTQARKGGPARGRADVPVGKCQPTDASSTRSFFSGFQAV